MFSFNQLGQFSHKRGSLLTIVGVSALDKNFSSFLPSALLQCLEVRVSFFDRPFDAFMCDAVRDTGGAQDGIVDVGENGPGLWRRGSERPTS